MTKNGWAVKDKLLEREFTFADFNEAMNFVKKVAILASKANHHPDICIHYNKVKISLTTHSVNSLTKKDYDLAAKIDNI